MNLAFTPSFSMCVAYYNRPVNVSVSLSGESDRDVTLTWEGPPGYADIVGFWYRVRLYSSSQYGSSYSNFTTVGTVLLWQNLAPSTYYCASVRAESLPHQYTYYSYDVCFYTGGSPGEWLSCTQKDTLVLCKCFLLFSLYRQCCHTQYTRLHLLCCVCSSDCRCRWPIHSLRAELLLPRRTMLY